MPGEHAVCGAGAADIFGKSTPGHSRGLLCRAQATGKVEVKWNRARGVHARMKL